MKIELSKIHPSPKPIRSTWDEEKMKDLSWSLREEGQVEPIGVHQNGNGYIIVWGHRRVEAARRAQWTEIDAVVVPQVHTEPQDEIDNLIKAGIENLASEDMKIAEKATWVQRLIDLGLTVNEISRRSSVGRVSISTWLTYSREKAQGVSVDIYTDAGDEGVRKIYDIAQVLGDDIDAKKVVAKKVSNEQLSQHQTRSVAEAYRDAPTPEVKQAVLSQPIESRDTSEAIISRAFTQVSADKVASSEIAFSWFQYPAIKAALEGIKTIRVGVSILRHSNHDTGAAQLILKQIRDALAQTVKEIDAILESVND